MAEKNPGAGFDEPAIGRELTSMRALLELSTLLTTANDETDIMREVTAAVPSLCDCRIVALRVEGSWLPDPPGVPDPALLEADVARLGLPGGRLLVPGVTWAWAYPLASRGGVLGVLVVAADAARQTAIAEQLRMANLELERSRRAAESAREAVQQQVDVHDRLTRTAVDGGGAEGIAQAVHELTGLPVAIEDRFGTLMAWAGPDRPEPYPKARPRARGADPRGSRARGAAATWRSSDRRGPVPGRGAGRHRPHRSRQHLGRGEPGGVGTRGDGAGSRVGASPQRRRGGAATRA